MLWIQIYLLITRLNMQKNKIVELSLKDFKKMTTLITKLKKANKALNSQVKMYMKWKKSIKDV